MPDALGGIGLRIGFFRVTIAPLQPLAVPAVNKANMLRGGFGHAFRRLCCVPQCRDTKNCPLANSCPYKAVFEPSPPPGAERLSKNQDIPRPFVFRAPETHQTRFEKDERFEFGLVLIGRALDFLPYFVLSFRELAREGLGLNRAKCALERVEELLPSSANFEIRNLQSVNAPEAAKELMASSRDSGIRNLESPNPPEEVKETAVSSSSAPCGRAVKAEPDTWHLTADALPSVPSNLSPGTSLAYSAEDQLFRATGSRAADEWIAPRLRHLLDANGNTSVQRVTIRFLTPTFLRAGGEVVRHPEFHHLLKRLRDRINALSTFFGDE